MTESNNSVDGQAVGGVEGADRTAGAGRSPHAQQVIRLADNMLRIAVWPAAGTVVLGAVVATVWVGLTGLWGALVGGVLGFSSSLVTLWLMRKTSGMQPMAVMAVSLGGYILKLLVLFAAMTLLGGISALHSYALAFTFLAVVLVWAGSEVLAFQRTKIPTIIPESSS
ncbi:hypothetical protein [Prauserella alba]|uniref:ATP synthase protein I n=1 Tax=Prauserella alba TaxID=176898 RepID=A0ABN1VMT1_9PSEU|nr:hypothetical protein [Prauserella alba]MCP2180772.1 hypothetical protein [Prauserella alba]